MQTKPLIALFVLGAIWGASFMFMRIAAPEFGVVMLVFIRTLLAAAVLIPFAVMAKVWPDVRHFWKEISFVGIVNTAVPFALFNYASLYLQAGVNAILNATAPMFAALIAWLWLKDKLTGMAIAGLGLGFAGVVMIGMQKNGTAELSLVAILAALGATMCYGIAASYIKRKLSRCKPLALAAGSQIAASLVLVLPALCYLPAENPSQIAWFSTLCLAVFGTGIAYILYFYLIAETGPAKAITVGYLVPLFGIIWGVLFLDERLSSAVLLGGAAILLGVMLTTGVFSRRRRSQR